MANTKKNVVLVNKTFLMILFALIIVLILMCSVLLGVVVSEKRSGSDDKQGIPVEQEAGSTQPTTAAPVNTAAPGAYVVNTTSDSLNLRSLPSSEGEILTAIPKGTTVTVSSVNNASGTESWGYVTFGQYSGWVNMKFLVPAPTVPAVTSATAG